MAGLKHFIWLIGLSAVAFWQLPQITSWPVALQQLLPFAPYIVGGLGIFVSLFLNRIQPLMLLLSLVVLNAGLQYFLPAGTQGLTAHTLFPILALLLPINLLVWLLLPERGVHDKIYTLFVLALFASQGYGVYWLMTHLPLEYLTLLAKPTAMESVHLPVVALVSMIVIWLLMVWRNAIMTNPKVLDRTMIFVLILMGVGLNQFHEFGAIAWLSLMASVLILLSLVFDAHAIAYTDQLTGLQGRRALQEGFLGLGRRYTIAMMDIDHFKSFNDTYGHDVGDVVLKTVADELSMISMGKVYRYGGEEFTVVFAGKTPEQALPALEQVRQEIERCELEVDKAGKKVTTHVTVSFGVAERNRQFKKPCDVMKAADDALYQAKEAGRNRVVVHGSSQKTTTKSESKKKPARKTQKKPSKKA